MLIGRQRWGRKTLGGPRKGGEKEGEGVRGGGCEEVCDREGLMGCQRGS